VTNPDAPYDWERILGEDAKVTMVHEHHHEHHQHTEASWGKRLIVTMILNLVIPIIQIYGGIVSGSMALISDALHNLSDFASVLVSYGALRLGQQGPTMKQTFGYKRVEVLASLFNVALLYGVGIYIAIEGYHRLLNPEVIRGNLVIPIALGAFIANAVSTLLLQAGAKVNTNMRSAFLHMLTDTLTSLAVAALGVVWIFRPWYWLDPIVSWIIVAMIFYGGWGLLKEGLLILMNATPPGIDLEEIQKALVSINGVQEIHDLHVWNPSPESIALAAHITVPDQLLSRVNEIATEVKTLLLCNFKIDHPILQFEVEGCGENGLLCSQLGYCPVKKKEEK
jgi:cobalt-zinc-cadmium efflux system protein